MSFREQGFINLGPHDFHRIVFFEWGDPENDCIWMCVHGWTRNGRDFDYLQMRSSAIIGLLVRTYWGVVKASGCGIRKTTAIHYCAWTGLL